MIIAVKSVPRYLPDIESERALVLSEMVRVLRPGGEARVFPVIDGGQGTMSISPELVEFLKSKGALVNFETVLVPTNDTAADNISRLIIQK